MVFQLFQSEFLKDSEVICFFSKTSYLLIKPQDSSWILKELKNISLILGYQRVVGDFLTLHAIITSLIDAGAHVDMVNNSGKSQF